MVGARPEFPATEWDRAAKAHAYSGCGYPARPTRQPGVFPDVRGGVDARSDPTRWEHAEMIAANSSADIAEMTSSGTTPPGRISVHQQPSDSH